MEPLTGGSVNWPVNGLEQVLAGEHVTYSCDGGFTMAAEAVNRIDCNYDGTLSGTLASQNIRCNAGEFCWRVSKV